MSPTADEWVGYELLGSSAVFNGSAVIEILTSVALLFAPTVVIGLLLGDVLSPVGITVSRILGIGMFALGVAVWEIAGRAANPASRIGICIYNIGVAGLLVVSGAAGHGEGLLLWPAAGLHGLIGVMMLWSLKVSSSAGKAGL